MDHDEPISEDILQKLLQQILAKLMPLRCPANGVWYCTLASYFDEMLGAPLW